MSMLCAKAIRAKRSKSSNVPLLPPQVLEASLIKFKEAGEGWLRQREQKGSSPTLEEIEAKGREDWFASGCLDHRVARAQRAAPFGVLDDGAMRPSPSQAD